MISGVFIYTNKVHFKLFFHNHQEKHHIFFNSTEYEYFLKIDQEINDTSLIKMKREGRNVIEQFLYKNELKCSYQRVLLVENYHFKEVKN
jgi:hypothetical protein